MGGTGMRAEAEEDLDLKAFIKALFGRNQFLRGESTDGEQSEPSALESTVGSLPFMIGAVMLTVPCYLSFASAVVGVLLVSTQVLL